jgi:hypothetical protein
MAPDASLFEPCDLDALLAPPVAKRAKKYWSLDKLPGVKAEILSDLPLMTRWRQDIHAHPELGFEEHRTADMVARLLATWGVEVHRGEIGGPTAVVGTLTGSSPSEQSVGLRADLDALPMQEVSSAQHKSTVDGRLHGCGHDGHTAMLLGAAKCVAQHRTAHRMCSCQSWISPSSTPSLQTSDPKLLCYAGTLQRRDDSAALCTLSSSPMRRQSSTRPCTPKVHQAAS